MVKRWRWVADLINATEMLAADSPQFAVSRLGRGWEKIKASADHIECAKSYASKEVAGRSLRLAPQNTYLDRYSAPTVKGAESSGVFTVHEPACRNELAEA